MRRLLVGILLLLPLALSAQKIKSGSLAFLKEEKSLNIIFDVSKARMMGASNESESMIIPLWNTDSTLLMKRFYYGVKDELEKRYFIFGDVPEANYKAVFHIQQVGNDGTVYSVVEFSPNKGDEILCTVEMVGNGGRLGTFLSLVGDGFDDLGETMGKLLKRNTKK